MKKINNKGFTLIEMLITVSLISIILIISISKFTFAIPDARNEAYDKTIESLTKAAALYVEDNKYNTNIIKQIGSNCLNNKEVPIKIDINTLLNSGYIKEKDNLPNSNDYIVQGIYNCETKKIDNFEMVDYVKKENIKIIFNNNASIGVSTAKINVTIPDNTEFKEYKCLYGNSESNLDKEGVFYPEGNDGYCYYTSLGENSNLYFKAILKADSETYETDVVNYKTSSLISPKVEYTDNCEMNKTINISNTIKDTNNNILVDNPIYYLKVNRNNSTRQNSIITNHTSGMQIYTCGFGISPENCTNPIKVTNFNDLDMWYKIIFTDKTISDYFITVRDNIDFSVVLSNGINYKYTDNYSITEMDYKNSIFPTINTINTYTSALNILTNNSGADMSCGIASYGIKVATYNERDKNCNTTDLRSKTVYSGITTSLVVAELKKGTNAPIHYLDRRYCYALCIKNTAGEVNCNSINSNNVAELKNLNSPTVTSSISGSKKLVAIKFDNNIKLGSGENLYIYSSLGATTNKSVSKCLIGKTLCSSSSSTITKNKWYKLKNAKEITLTYTNAASVSIKTYSDDGASTLSNSYSK